MTRTTPVLQLSTAPPDHPAMDYAFLRQEGIRHLEQLAGQLWTDFNTHDPGITILEQVCYAITDLAHRINYDLPDLLANDQGQADEHLYTPAQILPTNPVTLTDLRKLVIDIDGVKNAWVEKVTTQDPPLYFHRNEKTLQFQGNKLTMEPITLKGLYRIVIELSDLLYLDSTVGEQRQRVRHEVVQRLHAHRGLCEDFAEIRILDPEEIQVVANIEIEAVDHPEDVLLNIYQRIADYISPPIPTHSLQELLAAGKPVEEVFEGPLLKHGFIDTEALNKVPRRSVLYTSDLIREIMDVPTVKAVRSIHIAKGAQLEDWALDLDPQRAPRFSLARSVIQLKKNHLVASVNVETVRNRYVQALRQTAVSSPRTLNNTPDIVPPTGKNRHLGTYHSIQHQFPDAYGIGAMGLPPSASPQRVAQAQQLKAYLLFFDQLLANYFAQLANVHDLFSFTSETPHTYFAQAIDDPSLAGIRKEEQTHPERLQQITENPYSATELPNTRRRNRFLNHLLARFAEQFTDYSLILYGVVPEAWGSTADKLIEDKKAFLQNYPQLSSGRGTAVNYLQPESDLNRSGLAKRIQYKLGLVGDEQNFYIVEHILLRPMAEDTQQLIPILTNLNSPDPFSLQLSFVFPAWATRFKQPRFKEFVERVIYEETPAHLLAHIHWLDEPTMETFTSAYENWMSTRRAYWKEQ